MHVINKHVVLIYQKIEFEPQTADLEQIKRQWDAIAEVLPESPETWSPPKKFGTSEFEDMVARGALTNEFLAWWLATTDVTEERGALPKLARMVQQDPTLLEKDQKNSV
ncbi:MAG TPA: hypothetical protein VIS56_01590 [Candidatus Saccharimonadales bacterium]